MNSACVNIGGSEDHVGRSINQCRHCLGKLFFTNIKTPRHGGEVLTLDEAVEVQLIQKLADSRGIPPEGDQEPNAIRTTRLLRRCDERPRCQAANSRDERRVVSSIPPEKGTVG